MDVFDGIGVNLVRGGRFGRLTCSIMPVIIFYFCEEGCVCRGRGLGDCGFGCNYKIVCPAYLSDQ